MNIKRLEKLKFDFGGDSSSKKLKCLKLMVKQKNIRPETIKKYHDLLLFISAYPDSKKVFDLAKSELKRLGELIKENSLKKEEYLDDFWDTGIIGTKKESSFTFHGTQWLVEKSKNPYSLIFNNKGLNKNFDEFLFALLPKIEKDGLYNPKLKTEDWFNLGQDAKGDSLNDLLKIFSLLDGKPFIRDYLYESFGFYCEWQLVNKNISRTTTRMPGNKEKTYFYQTLIKKVDVKKQINTKIPKVIIESRKRGEELIDFSMAALLARGREIDPITHGNSKEVITVQLDRGMKVLLIGMVPEYRLPIESYYSFLMVKNSIPIGYGGIWVFGKRAEIGFNIFDSFRGGESALNFVEILRTAKQIFKVDEFTVDPFQFGANNPEGLHSGAFWFYYRLGFHSLDPRIEKLALKEWDKILVDKTYRSSLGTLKKFCKAKIGLSLLGEPSKTPNLIALGLANTNWIGNVFNGDRNMAFEVGYKKISKILPLNKFHGWSGPQKEKFVEMTPLLLRIKNLKKWSPSEKRDLVDLIKAKGGPKERTFSKLLQRNLKFQKSLIDLGSTFIT